MKPQTQAGRTTEPEFNVVLGQALQDVCDQGSLTFWAEKTQLLVSNNRCDVLVVGGPRPAAIEVELNSDPTGDAVSRLDERVRASNARVEVAVAVRPLFEVVNLPTPRAIRSGLSQGQLEYCVVTGASSNSAKRWPKSGFLVGDLVSLSHLVAAVTDSPTQVAQLASHIAERVKNTAKQLRQHLTSGQVDEISAAVGRPRGADGLRIACAVWLSALIFQDRIARHHRGVSTRRNCHGPAGVIDVQRLVEAWRKVVDIDYQSIYRPALTALDLVDAHVGTSVAAQTVHSMNRAAGTVLSYSGGAFDMGAELFPRLLADRSESAAYYTKATVAEFMAHIALPDHWQPPSGLLYGQPTGWKKGPAGTPDWRDVTTGEKHLRIGDLACGTGTLLRAAYKRLRATTERERERDKIRIKPGCSTRSICTKR